MTGGYSGCFLFVDLTTKKMHKEILDEKIARQYLGGYGIGSRILYDIMKKNTDPLGPDNILGILSGPLAGTALPFAARFTAVAKSPLTNCWGDANGSGSFGPKLKLSGFDGVFFSGCSQKPVYLLLESGEYKLMDAEEIWGRDTYSTEDYIKTKYGPAAEMACIGPAGENLSRLASIVTSKGRVAARSGLGAVMGSKRLKGVAAIGEGRIAAADPDLVLKLKKKYIQQTKDGTGFSNFYRTTGTPGHIESGAQTGDSPVKNWFGNHTELKDISEYSYENIRNNYITKKRTCFNCPMADWGHVIITKGQYKLEEEAHIPEYESSSAFGSYCMNTNFESIIKCNDICNRYGIDTISVGATVAFAINCYEEGIISKKDTGGIELTWGNHSSIARLTEMIARRDGIGDILADGVKIASEKIGKDSQRFAIHVGGQEIPAHDSRFEPTMASIYRNNATPGRHTQDAQFCVPDGLAELYPGIDFSFSFGNKREVQSGRAKAQKILSSLNHCVNASGMCLFGFLSTNIHFLPECLSAVTGWDIDLSEVIETGERIGDMRLAFTLREGINPLTLKYPDIALGKPPLKNGNTRNIKVDLNLLTKEFCEEMNWDYETGKPSRKRLAELGMEDLARDLWK
ncbi:MAG: aldehyde ferredoxin oxidoreductase family protein [Candidatus Humimicrobiaceae bacterium]